MRLSGPAAESGTSLKDALERAGVRPGVTMKVACAQRQSARDEDAVLHGSTWNRLGASNSRTRYEREHLGERRLHQRRVAAIRVVNRSVLYREHTPPRAHRHGRLEVRRTDIVSVVA